MGFWAAKMLRSEEEDGRTGEVGLMITVHVQRLMAVPGPGTRYVEMVSEVGANKH